LWQRYCSLPEIVTGLLEMNGEQKARLIPTPAWVAILMGLAGILIALLASAMLP
jgi:hypothetical protein